MSNLEEKDELLSSETNITQTNELKNQELPEESVVEETAPLTPVEEYYQTKETDRQEIVRLIEAAEEELADLRLRKSLMEADFDQLLAKYKELLSTDQRISPIAKKTLLEYFSYELMKPLATVGLQPSGIAYDIWSTKHFYLRYQLNAEDQLLFSFKLIPLDQKFTTEFMPLLTIQPDSMEVAVDDEQLLELIRLWHAEKIFSKDQLSLVNYDLNLLLSHFRQLEFVVQPSLLDNTQPLAVSLESEYPLQEKILDEIFITAMENPDYDFEKNSGVSYEVLLDQNQRLLISGFENGHTKLFIDSDQRKRSLLDFFTSYPFLVPLMVRSN
ncbi:hypothetical protein [Enterococcus songbeiensis]|uniref:hypothetical protein n=1 Tax=Enterococcus songbeiensis TaxID=2559927 RepID=UPI001FEA5029|nr:hypothetical protein [Enterococcus songbeiensis]